MRSSGKDLRFEIFYIILVGQIDKFYLEQQTVKRGRERAAAAYGHGAKRITMVCVFESNYFSTLIAFIEPVLQAHFDGHLNGG